MVKNWEAMFKQLTITLTLLANPLLFTFGIQSPAIGKKIIAQTIDCSAANSTTEIKYCSLKKYQSADEKLNQVYQKIIGSISGEQQKILITAQQAWIKFRDRNCNFETYRSRSGTGYEIFRNGCLERLTEQRTADLEKYLSLQDNFEKKRVSKLVASQLPDGNYRYVTADLPPPPDIIKDNDLVKAGGYYFLFRKIGSKVTGMLYQIDSEDNICITGRINQNQIIGEAIEYYEPNIRQPRVISMGSEFVIWDNEGHLKVRNGRKLGRDVKYSDVSLNLKLFNPINAGSQIPPRSCRR